MRKPKEPYDRYITRRKKEQLKIKKHLKGKFIWRSCVINKLGNIVPQQGTYTKLIFSKK